MRVLVADDHILVRAGIRRLLEDLPGVAVIAEADDGEQAIELAQRELPDLVITDIGMPRMTGLELTAWLKHNLPSVPVLILSMHASDDYVLEALSAGACGYLLKRAATEEIVLAIQAVMGGEVYVSAGVSRQIVQAYLDSRNGPGRQKITPRQREVLKLVVQGRTTKEIAARLGVSPRTIDTHRAELMERLGVRDAIGLLREASRLGLVDLSR